MGKETYFSLILGTTYMAKGVDRKREKIRGQ